MREGRRWGLARTEVIVEKAYSAVAGEVGIPFCDRRKPFRESARGAHIGSERQTKRAKDHRVSSASVKRNGMDGRCRASGGHVRAGQFGHMTVGKNIDLGGYHRIRQVETMISFLLKICAFLFASTHLSFLPHCCQLHQPEKNVSVMSPNHERTYIMVKVRPPLIAIIHPCSAFGAC